MTEGSPCYVERSCIVDKPTIEEAQAYAESKGYADFDATKFVAYHESRGWVVGRVPMKSWKAAVTTWALRDARKPERPQTLPGHAPGWDRRSEAILAQEGVDVELLRKLREAEK